jgi:hypothetical protein
MPAHYTKAVTLETHPDAIWPWLGADRDRRVGFYFPKHAPGGPSCQPAPARKTPALRAGDLSLFHGGPAHEHAAVKGKGRSPQREIPLADSRFLEAVMVIKAHRGHRYFHAAAGAREQQRPSRDSAVSAQRASPQTGGPVAARSFASVREPLPRLREVAAPGWRRWVPQAAIAWAAGYGALRLYWALGAAPSPPPVGTDLIVFTGWWPVALCAAAAVVVLGLRRAQWWPPLAVAAWAVTAALAAASALLLLDVVGLLLPGVGQGVHPVAFLSRAACLAGGVLVGVTALSYQRHWRGVCLACGRTGEAARPARPPRWAWLAAWAAVTGCLLRLLAQVLVGFGTNLRQLGGSLLLFEAGFLLAGTVLPLALVYRWGRVFPGWVPLLAGRRVPRWLVLGPALGLGVGMTAYFGVTMVKLAIGTVTGTWEQGPGSLPLWFFWVAVPGYLIWGLGLGAAALAYRRATRLPCRVCGR